MKTFRYLPKEPREHKIMIALPGILMILMPLLGMLMILKGQVKTKPTAHWAWCPKSSKDAFIISVFFIVTIYFLIIIIRIKISTCYEFRVAVCGRKSSDATSESTSIFSFPSWRVLSQINILLSRRFYERLFLFTRCRARSRERSVNHLQGLDVSKLQTRHLVFQVIFWCLILRQKFGKL